MDEKTDGNNVCIELLPCALCGKSGFSPDLSIAQEQWRQWKACKQGDDKFNFKPSQIMMIVTQNVMIIILTVKL